MDGLAAWEADAGGGAVAADDRTGRAPVVDAVQGLRQLTVTTVGQGRLLVGDRPVLRLTEVLEDTIWGEAPYPLPPYTTKQLKSSNCGMIVEKGQVS
ncbi:hypothetical protein [Streptomyces humi]